MVSLLIIVILIAIIIYLITYKKDIKQENNIYDFNGNMKKYIFTYHEKIFFEQLRRITDKNNCYIFPKMRIADIIDTDNISNFNKISFKHIDYTICNKSCKPILFIELDDPTHNYNYVKRRDEKKDLIFNNIGKKIIRVNENNRNKVLYYIDNFLKEIQT